MRTALLFLLISAGSLLGQIPASYFGLAVSQNTGVVWPNANPQPLSPTCVRAWDSGTDWASIELSAGVYTWAPLDTFVTNAAAHGQCVLWTIAKVPQFYSPVSSDSNCAELDHSCDGVADVNADGTGTDAHFSAFITAAQARYGNRIGYIEIWNEANNVKFCTSQVGGGTTGANCTAQSLLRMLYDAKTIYTTATFTSPSMCVCANSVFSQTTYATTNAKDGVSYFLAASIMSGAVTGANTTQIVAIHPYVGNNPAANIITSLTGTRTAMTTAGVSALPLWVTEDGWGANTVHSSSPNWTCSSTPPFNQTCLDNQAAYLAQLIALAASNNTQAFYWYQWGNQSQGTLYDKTNTAGTLFADGIAWQSIQTWLTGATFTGACSNSSTVWTCAITRANGYQAELVWDTAQTCTPCTTSTYTVPMAYQGGMQNDLAGDPTTVTGATTQIGLKPILLTNASCSVSIPGIVGSSNPIMTVGPQQVSVTVSGYPQATHAVLWNDYVRYGTVQIQDPGPNFPSDPKAPFIAPWTTQMNPALYGDGTHALYAKVYSVLQNEVTSTPMCTTPTVNYAVRVSGMSNNSISALPTTGPAAQLTERTFDGSENPKGANPIYIDGYPLPSTTRCGRSNVSSATGGWGTSIFEPTCQTNTAHLVMMVNDVLNYTDPAMKTDSFTGAASGTTITIPNHYHWQGSVVSLTTSATQPTPLTIGAQYYGGGTSYSVSGGLISITLPSAPAFTITTSTRVFIRNVSVNPQLGQACDGYYASIASVTSQTVFALTAPATCPNGLGYGVAPVASYVNGFYSKLICNPVFEVVLEPWFVVYTDANTVGFSRTATLDAYNNVIPGAPVTLSSGSGVLTVNQRLRSPEYGCGDGLDQSNHHDNAYNQPNYAIALATFSNGSAPLESEPQFDHMFNYGGQTDTLALVIKNDDLSTTAANCSGAGAGGATCVYADTGLGMQSALGMPTGQITFNASTQVITYVAPGSWTNPLNYPTATGAITITCGPTCAGNANGLLPVTAQLKNCGSGPCTTPHFSRTGPILSTYTPGSSFFPLNAGAEMGTEFQPSNGWGVSMMKLGFLNAAGSGLTADDNLSNPSATTCDNYSSSPPAQFATAEAWANAANAYLRFDSQVYWLGAAGQNASVLSALIGNLGFNRQSCFQSLLTHMKTSGRYFDIELGDEFSFFCGNFCVPDGHLGGLNWTSAVVTNCPGASCQIQFNTTNLNTWVVWNQIAGTGVPIVVTGDGTHSFLNQIFLPSSVTSGSSGSGVQTLVAPCSGCVNGTYSAATGAQISINPANYTTLPWFQNISAIPNNSFVNCISWSSGLSCGGQYGAAGQPSSPPANSNFASITISGSNATVAWTGVGASYGVGNTILIRIQGSSHLLNTAAYALVAANSLTYSYSGLTGNVAPSAGTYTSSNDSGLYLTVDSGLTNAANSYFALVNGVTGAPQLTKSVLGALITPYFNGSPSVALAGGMLTYLGYPNTSAMMYNANTPPDNLGIDNTVFDAATTCAGLGNACVYIPWHAQPVMDLVSVGDSFLPYAQNLTFTPSTDHPVQLLRRPENIGVQYRNASAAGSVGHQLYVINTNLPTWQWNCCGTQYVGTRGAPQESLLPFNQPIVFNGLVGANLAIKQAEPFELGPPCNHQYFGPGFAVDCHGVTPGFGGEVSIQCNFELPYLAFSVNTNAIAGGTLWLRQWDGYTLSWTQIAGNPSTLTREWCASPGLQSSIIAEVPGLEVVDMMSFGPLPSSPPGGAAKLVIRPTYTGIYNTIDNQGFDCTSGCQIPMMHANAVSSYQVLYMDSNYQPTTGNYNPPLITVASQGLY